MDAFVEDAHWPLSNFSLISLFFIFFVANFFLFSCLASVDVVAARIESKVANTLIR